MMDKTKESPIEPLAIVATLDFESFFPNNPLIMLPNKGNKTIPSKIYAIF
jgi:hypothetical protein